MQSVPTAVALPVENGAGSTARPERSPVTPPPPPRMPVDTALIPGRAVEPIDLANALRLAGARDLDIAIARQRVLQAAADLKQARALWLPSLFYGPTWYRADGQIQTITGQVETIDRSSLFLGATAALAQLLPRPIAGDWFPSLNGLSTTLRISDAIFEPMAARRQPGREPGRAPDRDQRRVATYRRSLLRSPGRQRSAGHRSRGRSECRGSLDDHEAYARLGEGLEARPSACNDRTQAPAQGYPACQWPVARRLGQLVRLLVLNPATVFAPIEPAECIIRLIPDEISLDDLIVQGLRYRPELANAQQLVEAALVRGSKRGSGRSSLVWPSPTRGAASAAGQVRSSATSGAVAMPQPASSGTCADLRIHRCRHHATASRRT